MVKGQSPFKTSTTIWLYRNILTSQVIISPTRVLSNSLSMAQLPPNRRLHPTALRKDHWTPLLKAEAPTAKSMNCIYDRMLEYRRWRKAEPVPLAHRGMRIGARRQIEINQVATSIADLSAACARYVKPDDTVRVTWMNEDEKVYAKTWPANVTHSSGLDVVRGYQVIEDRDDVLELESGNDVATTATNPA